MQSSIASAKVLSRIEDGVVLIYELGLASRPPRRTA